MLKPLKITCNLIAPLAGDAPHIDSVLEYELAMRMGIAYKVNRATPLADERIPIPLASRQVDSVPYSIYLASNPILPDHKVFQQHYNKRFESSMAREIAPEHRKSLLTASGPYKMQRRPVVVRPIDRIVWFAVGDRKEVAKLLRRVRSVGRLRNMGYGVVHQWDVEWCEDNWSWFAEEDGRKILMRTLPVAEAKGTFGYQISYGACAPPYWHPDRYCEIAVPC